MARDCIPCGRRRSSYDDVVLDAQQAKSLVEQTASADISPAEEPAPAPAVESAE